MLIAEMSTALVISSWSPKSGGQFIMVNVNV